MSKLSDAYNRLLREFGSQKWWPVTSNNPELEIIAGAILAQNTAWTNVEKAIRNLKENNLLDVDKIRKIESARLASLIRSSGYHNQKAKKFKRMAEFLHKNPIERLKRMNMEELRKELLGINGVGPETADSILLYALNKPSFVVDAYTKRIFYRIGLIDRDSSYDEIKYFFERNLTRDAELFNEYHALIVALGKNVCKKKPLCNICPLNSVCKKRI